MVVKSVTAIVGESGGLGPNIQPSYVICGMSWLKEAHNMWSRAVGPSSSFSNYSSNTRSSVIPQVQYNTF